MSHAPLSVAYVPLVDAAPLIVAKEMGYAREEGLELSLVPAPSWSSLRDMLAFGRVDAAHMLSPVPVAMALGIGGVASPISALMVLSVNGNVIAVSNDLAARLADVGHAFSFNDAKAAGQDLIAARSERLRIGVPFPFSMHAELLYYWLSASGLPAPQELEVKTVPPPLMADALAEGEIDAFCVGEPWGSKAVEAGIGALLLPTREIWTFAPEKVLAVRTGWAENEPELAGRLMRAVWRANRWLGTEGTTTTTAEMLAGETYLDLAPDIIDRSLTGRMVIDGKGTTRRCPGFLEFFHGGANFPWKSQAAWIASRMAARLGLDRTGVIEPAKAVYRTDLYRHHLKEEGAILPGASSKIEGGLEDGVAVAAEGGRLILAENRFFDDTIFDPEQGK